MALHERRQLREAIIAILLGKTAAGSRVKKSRRVPLPDDTLPAIHVYVDQEPVDEDSGKTAPRELRRDPQVVIEAFVSATADVDDPLDAIALEIETAMDADIFLSGCAFNSFLVNSVLGYSDAGARPMGAIQMTYSCVYHSDLRTKLIDDARPDFDQSDIKMKITPTQLAADRFEGLKSNIHAEPDQDD